ncbi:MAG: hypothetical protein LQ338_004240 [Usnochroma carphineum]|nr:MAG: hypothetical protein LQ338_007795 [Usnochroma carphineum]KAI4125437.1 MAG: hypothetical protein LQ338_004240 [Usnochroma carphineum]
MRVLILGGSGRTGRLVIDEALERGTPLNQPDIENAITTTPHDRPSAIIVTLNAVRVSDNPWSANASPPRMMADSNAHAVAAMKAHGIRKIVIMSAFGVADSWPNMHFLLRMTIKTSNMSHQWKDHEAVDAEVKQSGLDYVLVRPVMLKEGEPKPIGLHGNVGAKGVGLMSSITRKSVARFLVDAAEKSEWDRSTPVITN